MKPITTRVAVKTMRYNRVDDLVHIEIVDGDLYTAAERMTEADADKFCDDRFNKYGRSLSYNIATDEFAGDEISVAMIRLSVNAMSTLKNKHIAGCTFKV